MAALAMAAGQRLWRNGVSWLANQSAGSACININVIK